MIDHNKAGKPKFSHSLTSKGYSMRVTVLLLLIVLYRLSSVHFISATIYTCDPTVSCGCSALSTVVKSRIVGGEVASSHTWGWMVSLRRFGSHTCGASLITPEYALTAAHCVYKLLNNTSAFSIVAGTDYLSNNQSNTMLQNRTIVRIIIHPNFNSKTYTNDIAILQFSPLTISSSSELAFICLPSLYQDPFQTNSSLVAIGWGTTKFGGTDQSNALRQVTVQVFSSSSSDCLQSELSNSNIQFCAGASAGGKDTCQGDSGGPLMAFVNNRWMLAGITSFGYECALEGYPGVYTRVSAFASFIQSNTNVTLSKMPTATNKSLSKYQQTTIGNFLFISMVMLVSSVFLSFSSC